jgi:hypothetical protein
VLAGNGFAIRVGLTPWVRGAVDNAVNLAR